MKFISITAITVINLQQTVTPVL